MKFKLSLIGFASAFSISILPLATFSCSPFDPNKKIDDPVVPLTEDKMEEGEVFFYESLFNSNYFNKMLSTKNSFTKNDVISFAKKHPQIENFDIETQNLINQKLENINISQGELNQEITLDVGNIKFSYKLQTLNPLDIYEFNQKTHQVTINIENLNSFEEIFNVFGDVWNLRAKFNEQAISPFAQIYDYEFANKSIHNQNFSYLEKRAKVNSAIANVYSWDFTNKIVFKDIQGDNYTFEIDSLLENFKAITSLLSLYNEQNYFVQYNDSGYDILVHSIGKERDPLVPNFAAYPTIYFNIPSFEIHKLDQEKNIVDYQEWNNVYISGFLPSNSYIFYEKILSEVYNSFYLFSQSDVFTKRISKNFNKSVKVFEYDEIKKEVALNEFSPDFDYKNAPSNVSPEAIKNKKSRSYLEYMFSQWLFNSAKYVNDFKEAKLTDQEIKSLEYEIIDHPVSEESIEQFGSREIQIKAREMEKAWVPSQSIKYIPNQEQYLNKKYLVNISLHPKYGFRFSWLYNHEGEETRIIIKTFLEDDLWKITKSNIDSFCFIDDLLIFDDAKLQNNPQLIQDDNNNISDLMNIKYKWEELQNLIDTKQIPYEFIETRDKFVLAEGYSGYNKGKVTIKLDLTSTNLYFVHNDDYVDQIANQKLQIDIDVAFYYGFFDDVQEASYEDLLSQKNFNYLD